MTNKELQEKLKEFPDDIIVAYDFNNEDSTSRVEGLSIDHEFYEDDYENVLIIG
ncbi:hypothetical protein V6B05_05415 [Lactococcus garvieae]|uniref:hypothetical protein n=1 Tax=Lactococcus garvieae TaxID=1363 RepID=UPI001F61ABAF|nr:hypothetical protein [Lactococcus garvieae]MCI3860786.1 hypothetical protein [Lactococcus garvieae]